MRLFPVFLSFVGLFVLTCLGGCTDKRDDIVRIGVIAPLSGPAAVHGHDMVTVIEHAVAAYQEDYEDVVLLVEDGKCSGKDAASAAQKLIVIDQVDVIIGGLCSSETFAAGAIAENHDVVMLSPLSSAPGISDLGDNVFRFWNDTQSVDALGSYMNKHRGRVAVLYENTDYGVALREALRDRYDGSVVFDSSFSIEEKDFAVLAKQVAALDTIDAIVLVTHNDASTLGLMKAFAAEGLLEQYQGSLIGTFVFSASSFATHWADDHGLLEVQLADANASSVQARDFLADYTVLHTIKTAPIFVLLSQEAISLVLDAVRGGHKNAGSMRDYFVGIDQDNPRIGYFGDYYFDQYGDAVGLSYVVQQHVGGSWVVIE